MSKSPVALGFLGLLCACAALWFWHEMRAERQRADALELRLTDAMAAVEKAETAFATAAEPASTAAAVPSPTPAPTSSPPARKDPERDSGRLEQQMVADPVYRKSMLEEGRRRFAQVRADAIRVVGMTPEQADRVIELQVERNLRFLQLADGSGGALGEAAQAAMKRGNDAEQAELLALLGEVKLQQWHEYLQSSSERGEANAPRSQLASSTTPLTQSQVDTLTMTLHAEYQRREREYAEYIRSLGSVDRDTVPPQHRQRWVELAKEASGRIHESLAGTLSGDQLAQLDAMLAARIVSVETAIRLELDGKVAKSN